MDYFYERTMLVVKIDNGLILGTVRLAVKIKNGKRFCVRFALFIIKLETLLLFFDAVRTTVENSNVKRYFLPP